MIKTTTFRKVALENSQGVKTSSVKKKINISVKIEEIEYDNKEGLMRLKGKNVSQNEYVNIGQYQSIEIGMGNFFTLFKKCWDDVHIEKLHLASDRTITADLAAILMEEGIAHIYLISSNITDLKAKIELSIAKKRKGPSQHDKVIILYYISIK
jgi:protein pelota